MKAKPTPPWENDAAINADICATFRHYYSWEGLCFYCGHEHPEWKSPKTLEIDVPIV